MLSSLWHREQREAKVVLPTAAFPEKPPVELDDELLDELLLEEELLLLDELLLELEEELLLDIPLEDELLLDELLLDEPLEDDDPPPPQAASIALNIPIISIFRIIDVAPHVTTATSSHITRLTTNVGRFRYGF